MFAQNPRPCPKIPASACACRLRTSVAPSETYPQSPATLTSKQRNLQTLVRLGPPPKNRSTLSVRVGTGKPVRTWRVDGARRSGSSRSWARSGGLGARAGGRARRQVAGGDYADHLPLAQGLRRQAGRASRATHVRLSTRTRGFAGRLGRPRAGLVRHWFIGCSAFVRATNRRTATNAHTASTPVIGYASISPL